MRKLVLAAEEEANAAAVNPGSGCSQKPFVYPGAVGAAVPVNVDAMDRGQKIALAVFVVRLHCIQNFS